MWSDLTLDLSFKVKCGKTDLKVLLTLFLEFWDVKSTSCKSWANGILI